MQNPYLSVAPYIHYSSLHYRNRPRTFPERRADEANSRSSGPEGGTSAAEGAEKNGLSCQKSVIASAGECGFSSSSVTTPRRSPETSESGSPDRNSPGPHNPYTRLRCSRSSGIESRFQRHATGKRQAAWLVFLVISFHVSLAACSRSVHSAARDEALPHVRRLHVAAEAEDVAREGGPEGPEEHARAHTTVGTRFF